MALYKVLPCKQLSLLTLKGIADIASFEGPSWADDAKDLNACALCRPCTPAALSVLSALRQVSNAFGSTTRRCIAAYSPLSAISSPC